MSAGIGYYNSKNTKQRLRQAIADKRNAELGQSDIDYYENFDNFIPTKERPQTKKGIFENNGLNTIIPFEDRRNVHFPSGPYDVGLNNTHNCGSEYHNRSEYLKGYYKDFNDPQNAGTRQTERAQMTQDKASMKNAHRDHLDELFDPKLVPGVKKTQMREDYTYTQYMQNDANNVNFDHHALKNDMNQFTEAYMKYKDTMRTFGKKENKKK